MRPCLLGCCWIDGLILRGRLLRRLRLRMLWNAVWHKILLKLTIVVNEAMLCTSPALNNQAIYWYRSLSRASAVVFSQLPRAAKLRTDIESHVVCELAG